MKRKGRFKVYVICPIILMFLCTIQMVTICPVLKVRAVLAQDLKQNQENNKENNKMLLDRIDFGNAYIMGQTIKSGAVYLLQRKKSEIKSMLQYRKDYRREILENFHIRDMKIKTPSP